MANPSIVVEFLAETSKLVGGVKDVQKAGEGASSALGKINFRSVAKWSAVAGAAVATVKVLKSSSEHVADLAKETTALSRATNLDARTSSAWVETLKVRDIAVSAFQTSLVRLSKLMEKSRLAQANLVQVTKDYNEATGPLAAIVARGGEAGKQAAKDWRTWDGILQKAQTSADKANAPFQRLGVSLADVRKGNVQAVLLQAADGFAKIKNPATRAAAAAELFGRMGQKLLPILVKGSKGIQEQLDLASKYGATIGEKTVKQVADLVQKQRELKLAQDGVKTSIGTALLPAQVELYGSLLSLVQIILPLTKNVDVMKGVLIAAAVAWGAYKVAVIASTVASLGLNAAMLPQIAIAAAIVVGIAALIAIGVLLYKNWDKIAKVAEDTWGAIKRGAMATLNWLKQNWPLILGVLLGPFALGIVLVARHWDQITGAIKGAVTAALSWLRANWQTIVAILTGPLGLAVLAVVRSWDRIEEGARGAVNAIKAAFGVLPGFLGNLADHFARVGQALASAVKGPINTVLRAWNALKLPGFKVKIPGPLPDIKFPDFNFPNVALLAGGGIVTGPTLAMVGESGPEAVIPLSGSNAPIEVRVFIGDEELRTIVRKEVGDSNVRTAQVLLAGRFGV